MQYKVSSLLNSNSNKLVKDRWQVWHEPGPLQLETDGFN